MAFILSLKGSSSSDILGATRIDMITTAKIGIKCEQGQAQAN